MKAQTIYATEVVQHSCFRYQEGDVIVTVYSPTIEVLTHAQVNWYLDRAKDKLLERDSGG